jgi:hypothetical protein
MKLFFNREELVIQRILVHHDVRFDFGSRLIADIKRALEFVKLHRVTQPMLFGKASSFNSSRINTQGWLRKIGPVPLPTRYFPTVRRR